MFAAPARAGMEASVSNFFSAGDKVIVCSAGKFGERWVEIAKAYGLKAIVLKAEYGEVVRRSAWQRARAEPATQGRVRPGVRDLDRRGARRAAMAEAIAKTGRHLRRRRDHRPRHHAARYRRLGARRGDRRLAEGVHDPARPGLHVRQPEGVEARRDGQAAALLLRPEEGEEERRRGRIELDALHQPDPGAGRSAEVHQADRHGQADRERAAAGARHARGRHGAGPGTVRARVRRAPRSPPSGRPRAWIPARS